MKKIICIFCIFFLVLSVASAKKYSFVEVGHSNINITVANVTDISKKNFDQVEFIQLPISAGKSLSRDAKNLSSTVLTEIMETLHETVDLAKGKGVADIDILIYFSSSYDYLVAEEKTRIITKVKQETGLTAEFVDAYTEGKAITETTLRSLGQTATVAYLGSSTTKGGTVDANPQTGKMRFQSFDIEYGIRKLKDRMLADKPVDQDSYLDAKNQEIGLLIEEAISSKPIIKQRTILVLCGDGPYYLSVLLGKQTLSISDLVGLKQKLKNPTFLQSKGVAENIDINFALTAIHFVQTVIEKFGMSDVRVDIDERSFALGLGLRRLKERE